jgi:hypothetical protein
MRHLSLRRGASAGFTLHFNLQWKQSGVERAIFFAAVVALLGLWAAIARRSE